MKIIISPSKTLKAQPFNIEPTQPQFNQEAQNIKDTLLNYDLNQLEECFHVSNKLAKQIYHGLRQVEQYPALFYYTGTVFKQLQLPQYETSHYDYLDTHLCILDALYGCLKYSDLISFYRLDYLSQIGINLYDYWHEKLNFLFNKEEVIINLASQEFSKGIHHPNLITIDFIIVEKDKIKRPSMLVKKARGMMLNHLILHKIKKPEELKTIEIDGYLFDVNRSNHKQYVFSRSID